jgi:hypothetical protein
MYVLILYPVWVVFDRFFTQVVPLSHLFRHSFAFSSIHIESEAVVAKALRNRAADGLEVRMLVSAPSTSRWYGGNRSAKEELGGYEVRRTDFGTTVQRDYQRSYWEERTIYLVCTFSCAIHPFSLTSL